MRMTDAAGAGGTRGAITVVAVFMAVALVGALWLVVGIGDALLYRQQLQDAADAAAYTGALYHARGMNLLALINVVMAAIVAVMVALRLVELLNLAAMVLSCAVSGLCSVGVGCWAVPICTYTTQLRPQIANIVRQYREGVADRVLPALGRAATGVARHMPRVAQDRAAAVAQRAGGAIRQTGLLTLPLPSSEALPLGLPVQVGEYDVLCAHAGEGVVEVAFDPFPFGDWLAKVTGSMVSSFPAYFCGDRGRPSLTDERPAIDEQCAVRRQAYEQRQDGEFDMEACRDAVRQELAEAFGEATDTAGAADGDLGSVAPMQVYSAARNGNEWLQIRALADGDPTQLKAAEVGVRVARWGRQRPAVEVRGGRISVAQAELYYDTDRRWDDVREEALWNPRWRARLRRFRAPEGGAELVSAPGVAGVADELAAVFRGEPEVIH